ncbi:MAG: hypothetical protein O6924_07825, partial [Alphaproteobacteria bacterium]|nr:hypothetical protein [Alphaproteobacteria bacterium]
MNKVTTIGLDLSKNVFPVHGVDASGEVVIRKPLHRRQVMPFFGKPVPEFDLPAHGTSTGRRMIARTDETPDPHSRRPPTFDGRLRRG